MLETDRFDYKIDPEHKKKITVEEAKFIFEQGEKSFNDTIETSKKIFERSSSALTLLSGIIIGLVAYAIGRYEKNGHFDELLLTTVVAILYYLTVGYLFVFPNIKPTEYNLPGTQPKRYFHDQYFNANPPQGRAVLPYLIEIKNLQDGIEENVEVNKKRWERYKKSLNWIFYSPIVIGAIYLMAKLIIA